MADTHDRKSHDYASNSNPYGNYEFAGWVASLFSHSPADVGFVSRIAEKIYRLSILEGGNKQPKNESIEDTETDIAVITCLWMARRQEVRKKQTKDENSHYMDQILELEKKITPSARNLLIEYLKAHALGADITDGV